MLLPLIRDAPLWQVGVAREQRPLPVESEAQSQRGHCELSLIILIA